VRIVPALLLSVLCLSTALYAGDPKPTAAWTFKGKKSINNYSEVCGGKYFWTREGNYAAVINNTDGSARWEADLKDLQEKAFSLIWNDNMFVFCTKKEMVALDLETGSEKYRFALGSEVDPTDYNGYINTSNGVLIVYKDNVGFYDVTNGKQLWLRKDKSMTVDNYDLMKNGHFIGLYGNGVAIIDYKTGQSLWSSPEALYSDLKFQYYTFTNSEGTGGSVLFFMKKSTALVSWDGKPLWSIAARGSEERGGQKKAGECQQRVGNTLTVFLEKQIVGVHGLTGAEGWREDVKDEDDIAEADVYAIQDDQKNDRFGLITVNGALLNFDAQTGQKLWRTPDETFVGQMCKILPIQGDEFLCISGKRAFLMTNGQLGVHMYRINMKDGKILWHSQSRAMWSNAVGNSAKTTYDGVASGPYLFPEIDRMVLVTNTGVNVFTLSDGKLLKDGKWMQNEIGNWKKHEYTVDKTNMVLSVSLTPPVGLSAAALGPLGLPFGGFKLLKSTIMINRSAAPAIVGGTLFFSGDDKIFAYDLATGKEKWNAKARGPVVAMLVREGVVYAMTGLYIDSNILFGLQDEKPMVYYNKGDFGFIAFDAATGKELWKFQEFEANDPVFLTGIIVDKADLEKKEKSECNLKKLKVGQIFNMVQRPNYVFFWGVDGLAGVQYGSDQPCKSNWRVKGDVKKARQMFSLTDDSYMPPVVLFDKTFLADFGGDLYYFDEAAQQLKWKADGGERTLYSTHNRLIYVMDGKELTAYKMD
jgi:outer membrane protein assembly factor BamB